MQQVKHVTTEEFKMNLQYKGRPKSETVRDTMGVSMLPELRNEVDRWAHLHNVSRSRAIEIFVEQALRKENNHAVI